MIPKDKDKELIDTTDARDGFWVHQINQDYGQFVPVPTLIIASASSFLLTTDGLG